MIKKSMSSALALLVVVLLIFSGVSFAIFTYGDDADNVNEQKEEKIESSDTPSYRLATAKDVENLKDVWGVREPGKNYNEIINGHGTGLAPPTEEEYQSMIGNLRISTGDETTRETEPTPRAATEYMNHQYMPPIGDQGGQGSCAAFSASYYALTFQQAWSYGQNVNGGTWGNFDNPDYIMSPGWSYNKANNGNDEGSNWGGLWDLSDSVGNSNINEHPYNDGDFSGWGSESAWRNAAQFRSTGHYSTANNDDDAAINGIKDRIDEGRLPNFGIDANAYPTDNWGNWNGDEVVSTAEWGTEEALNHAQTIIGYDDAKADGDGSGETGAFHVANSWGTGWGPVPDGTFWMTYDCFKTLLLNWTYELEGGSGIGAKYDSTNANSPSMLGTWTFSQAGDRDPAMKLGVADTDGGTLLDTRSPVWDGSSATSHNYPTFMSMDLTEFENDWNQGADANYFSLDIGASSGTASTLDSFYVEYYDDGGYDDTGAAYTDISINSPDVPDSNPCVVWTTFTYPDGVVMFDQEKYAVEDSIGIRVEDEDLTSAGSVSVDVNSPQETETLALAQDARYAHVWTGSITCSGTDAGGVLHVAGGDTISVSYADASHGTKTDSAVIDTTGPVISSGPTEAIKIGTKIEWTTDELAQSTINYGLDTSLAMSVSDTDWKSSHSLVMDTLDDGNPYYYEIVMTNEAGITTTDDNGGSYYTFTAGNTDDVESENVGWTQQPQGPRSRGRWAVWGDNVHGGSYSWNLGGGAYGNSWCENLTSPWIDISNADAAEWTWWHYYDVEDPGADADGVNGPDYWDGFVVEVQTDNTGGWERATPDTSGTSGGGYDGYVYADFGATPLAGQEVFGGASGGWVDEKVDLTPWIDGVATKLQVKYYFASDAAVAEYGVDIDDIMISTSGGFVPPSITVTDPNGGEQWNYGTDHAITWSTTTGDYAIDYVNLHYSTDSGGSWTTISTSETDDGTYTWNVPNDPSVNCLVRATVYDTEGYSASDTSDAEFEIVGSTPPSITVTSPNGGESWEAGTQHDITWSTTAGDGNIVDVDLKYSSDGGTSWTSISTGETDDGIYPWNVPNDGSTTCLVNATVNDDNGQSGYDGSDDYFEIVGLTPPEVTVTAPNGGESWQQGTNQTITWSTTPNDYVITGIDIKYSVDGGATYTDIILGTDDDGIHHWDPVPDNPSQNCYVKVIAKGTNFTFNDYENVNDTSDAAFEIYNYPDAPSGLTVEHYGVSSTSATAKCNGIDANDDAGTTTAAIEFDDGTYATNRKVTTWLDSFDTSGASDPVTAATLWFEYSTDGGYNGNNPLQVSNDEGTTWTNTGIVPADTGGQANTVVESYDLYGNGVVGELADITNLDVEFTSNDGAQPDDVYFDYFWVEYTYGGGGGSTDDNAVNWTASADDGAGDNDVDYYNIYRADTQAGLDTASVYTTVTADGSASYSYMDSGAGTADTTIWWYRVCGIDLDGRASGYTSDQPEPSPTQPFHDLGTLDTGGSHEGWHFLSYNLTRADTSLTSILDDSTNGIPGNYDKVMCYDASTGEWMSYVPGRADTYNDLYTWTSGMGIWVHMTGTDDLVVMGDSKPTTTDIQLYEGWNMVSYPSSTSSPSDTELPAEVTNIGYFDGAATYNIAYTAPDAGFNMNPGDGYWLYCTANTMWTVTY